MGGNTQTAGAAATNGGGGNADDGGAGPDNLEAPFTKAEQVRIMAFGDSTTATGCGRKRFWEGLQASGYVNVDMIGSGDSER
jgi:hypothetical protein